jgi:hypothetical protein
MRLIERGDLEPTLRDADDSDAKFRAALDEDRQRAQQVRRVCGAEVARLLD